MDSGHNMALTLDTKKHFQCKSLLNGFISALVLENHKVVISLRHTDEVVSSFSDLLNVRDNYMYATNFFRGVSKEFVLSWAIEFNQRNCGYQELHERALNNAVDYLYLTVMHQADTDVDTEINHLIYANFGMSSRMKDIWEVSDTPVLGMGNTAIVEAYYCFPDM